jgi:hypothetical protein
VIPKISRGSRPIGLFRYLIGKGSRNEHTDPHLVAGSPDLVWQFGGRQLVSRDATSLGCFVDELRRLSGTTVTIVACNGEGNVTGRRVADIWHCPLSLHSDETALSDETWRQNQPAVHGEDGVRWRGDRGPLPVGSGPSRSFSKR